MKNINEILAGLDIQIPEDKQAEFDKTFAENYKTIADYDRQKDKLAHAEGDLKTARESLEAFKDVDVKDLQSQISKLTQDLQNKDAAHAAELADRDFSALLDTAISAKHGRSTKAVKALLDMDSLKASKNQQADIDAALDQLAKDSSYLFDDGSTPPPYAGGTGTQGGSAAPDAALRAAFGLNPEG